MKKTVFTEATLLVNMAVPQPVLVAQAVHLAMAIRIVMFHQKHVPMVVPLKTLAISVHHAIQRRLAQ